MLRTSEAGCSESCTPRFNREVRGIIAPIDSTRNGKAAIFRRFPFTLVLKESLPNKPVQTYRIKIDPGAKTTRHFWGEASPQKMPWELQLSTILLVMLYSRQNFSTEVLQLRNPCFLVDNCAEAEETLRVRSPLRRETLLQGCLTVKPVIVNLQNTNGLGREIRCHFLNNVERVGYRQA